MGRSIAISATSAGEPRWVQAVSMLEEVLLVAALGALLVCLSTGHTSSPSSFWNFVSSVIFFGNIHVALTFFLFLRLPEAKRWARAKLSRSWLAPVLLIAGFLLVFCWAFARQFTDNLLLQALAIPFTTFKIHHGVRQHAGIGSLALFKRAASDSRPFSHSRWQRLSADWACLLIGISLTMQFMERQNWFLQPTGLTACFSILGALPALMLALHQLVTLGSGGWKIASFSVRIALYPLGFLAPWVFFFTSAIHGLEYLRIYQRMSQRSKSSKDGFQGDSAPLPLSLLKIFIMGSLLLPIVLLGFRLPQSDAVSPLLAIGISLAFSHYFIDSRLFQFRDEHCRKEILPLLR